MSETNIKIYRNDELIHDCTLCKNPEGRVGWYDAVDGTFHDRADAPASREPLSVQYIDTGFYPLNKQGAPHIDAGNKWISVEERLPEDERKVLVYYGFDNDGDGDLGIMFIGTLSYFRFDPDPHWQHASLNLVVTHWMHLPEPPEVDT